MGMTEREIVRCRFCFYFGYLDDEIPEIKKDGWCILRHKFMDSNDKACINFAPRLKTKRW